MTASDTGFCWYWKIRRGTKPTNEVLTSWGYFFFQVLIPISLYISIELVKLGQVFLIHNDIDLYDEERDFSIQCRALNITEDLGQIQHIFSDKTGTLTENKMVFRRCTINGNEFSHQENGERCILLHWPFSLYDFLYLILLYLFLTGEV